MIRDFIMILSVFPLLFVMCLFVSADEEKGQAKNLQQMDINSTQPTSDDSVIHHQRYSENCLIKQYTSKSCYKVFCQPWEKCLHGVCICKLPYQCPKTGSPVCSSTNRTFRSYCQLKSYECQRKKGRFSHFGACTSGHFDVHLESDHPSQGIVLFSLNQTDEKIPICLDENMWTMHEANVVCRQHNFMLGAEKILENIPIKRKLKTDLMVIWSNETRCRGAETSLTECFQLKNIGSPWGGCKKVAAVKCYHYPERNCTRDEFNCVNGKCIPLKDACNGIDDCGDLSDELCCTECKNSYFCKSGICIPHVSVCDGEDDCLDGGDESNCNVNSTEVHETERIQLKSSLSKISCGVSHTVGNTTSSRSKRLVGGKEASKGQFPWQIAVYNDNILNCGGIFIGGCWILTAAHCLRTYYSSKYVVRIGKFSKRDISKREEIMPVIQIIIHHEYNPKTFKNDIALLKIDHIFKDRECIPLSEDVQPVCIPWSEYIFRPNKTCIVSGWGQAQENTRVSILRWAEVDIIGNCSSIYKSDFYDGMECAGKMDGSVDSCKGDSGGPLVCTDERNEAYVWGIVSWGEKCGEPGHPGVYTKVSHYFDWIVRHVGRDLVMKYNA
ncbi:complement factor I isoform X2 [Narcine bancroftii]|uniref:complement factor I isoform X2 n=1 Tax=Narcine bancroftii TaxID=1343680 RepID=UPI003831C611